jgi:hypothetical protein
MITRHDWETAADEFMAAERERLGGLPTPEEIDAYFDRTLPESEVARVRALLVDQERVLTPSEIASDWASLQARMRAESARRRSSMRLLAIAAVAGTTLFGGLLAYRRNMLHEPLVPHVLMPARQRGGAPRPYELSADETRFMLLPVAINAPRFTRYRIDILDVEATPARVVTRVDDVTRRDDETFAIIVSRSTLAAGTYRLELYGVNDARVELLEHYAVHVASAR